MCGALFSLYLVAIFHWSLSFQDEEVKTPNYTESLYDIQKRLPIKYNQIPRANNLSLGSDFYTSSNLQRKPRRVSRDVITGTTTSLINNFIIYLHSFVDSFIDRLFGLFYIFQRQHVLKPKNLLVFESAISIARKIQKRHVTSEEVVQAFAERIIEVNPIINAVTDTRFEDAIREAKEIDQDIANGRITEDDFKQKPFLESTACKGMKHTFGLLSRKDVIAEEDADVVKLVKKAGGILLAVTNVPQLCMWQETSNPVFGTTNNPYDTSRNVGGSSGGEAAIIIAFGSPIGIGTDIGGSIRIPAFMCGVFGHKPSSDLIPTKGVMYRTGNEGPTISTPGPMTKHAEDIIPFLKILLGNNVNRLKLDENVNVTDLQVYYMLEFGDPRVSVLGTEMKEIILRTVDYFNENSKKPPIKLDLPNIKYGGDLWRYWMSQEADQGFETNLTNRKGRVNPYWEIVKFFAFRYFSEYTAATVFNLINRFFPKVDAQWARRLTAELKNELVQKLGNIGVLLYPSAPWSARHHHTALFRPWNFYYFAIWNALKMPVTQVPLGLDSNGLPVGIQVVCAPYQDHLCIAVAMELEQAFGGYMPPFDVDEK